MPPGVLCRALLFDVLTEIHPTVPTQTHIPHPFRLTALDGARPEIAIALRSVEIATHTFGPLPSIIWIDSLSIIVTTLSFP